MSDTLFFPSSKQEPTIAFSENGKGDILLLAIQDGKLVPHPDEYSDDIGFLLPPWSYVWRQDYGSINRGGLIVLPVGVA
ncbi:MAG: hypothetical protein K9M57_01740 [Phycisphaerae bacterium]|nr:hypothetical protein [Phycisphaerae bacterium]